MKKTGGSCLAEYRRFVAYVYEYQKEKKGSNCGFVKIEVRGEICRIELHLQCPGPVSYTHLDVYKRQVMGDLKGKADGKLINQVVADICK